MRLVRPTASNVQLAFARGLAIRNGKPYKAKLLPPGEFDRRIRETFQKNQFVLNHPRKK